VCDQAFADVDHLMGAMGAQPCHPVRAHRELHPRPPAQARARFLVTGQGLDGDLAVEARQSPELLAEHGGLECPLGGQRRVLPVAAPAAAGASVRARRLYPVG
jgi:hypothetical protein